jgi:hypothetical protein
LSSTPATEGSSVALTFVELVALSFEDHRARSNAANFGRDSSRYKPIYPKLTDRVVDGTGRADGSTPGDA